MKHRTFFLSGIAAFLLTMPLADAEPFTVEAAVARALADHPALQGAHAAVAMEAGSMKQAGLPPNPELELGMENWAASTGNGQSMEIHAGLTQPLPLSGARRAARRALQSGVDASKQTVEDVQRRIVAAAERAFYEVLAAREHAAIVRESAEQAQALATLTRERLAAGDIAEVDYLRAAAEQARYEAELEQAVRRLDACRRQLAAVCGMDVSALPECEGQIALEDASLPDWETLRGQFSESPRNRSREYREQQARLETEVVRRASIPDPAVYLGWRRDTDTDVNGLDVGIRIALPLFDRNQGARAAAEANAKRVCAENEAARREELLATKALFDEITSRREKAARLRREVLPRQKEVGLILERAVEIGDMTLFEVLAARQHLAALRLDILEQEIRARLAWTDLKALR